MNKNEVMYKVTNRSASKVVYKDPELNIRREFMPNETKMISFAELEKLSFIPGGREMMANFLQLEPIAVKKIGIPAEPEYFMSRDQVQKMLLQGPLDQFLDCLDFAPQGVIDLVKQLSISLPLTDIQKRRALKEKLGFDVDAALRHIEEEYQEEQADKPKATRRVKIEQPEIPTGRRTAIDYQADMEEELPEEEEIAVEEVIEPAVKKTGKRGRKPATVEEQDEE